MSSEQPQDLRAILRRIQDLNVPMEEANELFKRYVIPELNRIIASAHFPKDVRGWVEENAHTCMWKKLVVKPRNDHRPAYDVDRERSSFRAWALKVLRNEASTDYRRSSRKRRLESLLNQQTPLPDPRTRNGERPTDDEEEFDDGVEGPSYQTQEAPIDDEASVPNKLKRLKQNLADGLRALMHSEEFSQPGQRSNAVDYFAVLLIQIRLQLTRKFHEFLYAERPEVACGQVVLDYVGDVFKACEQSSALICIDCETAGADAGNVNRACERWCERRPATWTPTVAVIIAALDQRLRNNNARPKDIWIAEHLSQVAGVAHNNNASRQVTNTGYPRHDCWRQWVRRMRLLYHRACNRNQSLLTPKQARILDFFLAADRDASSDTGEEA